MSNFRSSTWPPSLTELTRKVLSSEWRQFSRVIEIWFLVSISFFRRQVSSGSPSLIWHSCIVHDKCKIHLPSFLSDQSNRKLILLLFCEVTITSLNTFFSRVTRYESRMSKGKSERRRYEALSPKHIILIWAVYHSYSLSDVFTLFRNAQKLLQADLLRGSHRLSLSTPSAM